MKLPCQLLVIVLCITLTSARAMAQDVSVANPSYAAWIKAPIGTTVVYTGNSKTMGLDTTVETSMTLKAIAADRVTVEVSRKITTQGNTTVEPKGNQEIKAVFAPAEAYKFIGETDIYVLNKTLRCKVYEQISKQGDMTIVNRTCFSDEVLGGMVRAESRTEGPVAMNTQVEIKEAREPGK